MSIYKLLRVARFLVTDPPSELSPIQKTVELQFPKRILTAIPHGLAMSSLFIYRSRCYLVPTRG